jgi:hypothetical protein
MEPINLFEFFEENKKKGKSVSEGNILIIFEKLALI